MTRITIDRWRLFEAFNNQWPEVTPTLDRETGIVCHGSQPHWALRYQGCDDEQIDEIMWHEPDHQYLKIPYLDHIDHHEMANLFAEEIEDRETSEFMRNVSNGLFCVGFNKRGKPIMGGMV